MFAACLLAGCQHVAVGTHNAGGQYALPYTPKNKGVKTDCFPRDLVEILGKVEKKYGKKPLVTSGHRPHGKLDGSRHLTCDAADIRVAGIRNRDLARYVRTLPNVGGVGTYCDRNIVHVDVGRRRDWKHGC